MSTMKVVVNRYVFLITFILLNTTRSEENVALTGTARQSTTQDPNWAANKAIDNCTNQVLGQAPHCCSHTALGHKQAWWRVELKQSITIQLITIYYRESFEYRFGGYSLYVSNSTDHTQGIRCYQDTSNHTTDVDLNPTHLCPYVARYVIVYNHRENPKRHDWYDSNAVLELCEVQVFGCPTGNYGNGSCFKSCPGSCYGGNCNAITGSCFYCVPGVFGDFCEHTCSVNCNNTCEKDSGHCKGCKPGKTGNLCSITCSKNCMTCDQTSDKCFDCIPGKFGESCEQPCSTNCNNTCEKDSGHCNGCKPGKAGDLCTATCPVNCVLCDQTSYNCFGCQPGKTGTLCNANCPMNCITCDQTSSKCFDCVKGKHGELCDLDCPKNCKDGSCIKENGRCLSNLIISIFQRCIPGKKGHMCNNNCASNCLVCEQASEQCFRCKDGYFTEDCDRRCPTTCTTNVCDMITGYCIEPASSNMYKFAAIGIGIGSGVVILALVVLVILLVRRHSMDKGDNTNSTHMTDLSQSERQHELQKHKDATYEEIGSEAMKQPTQPNITEERYEQLSALKSEPTHVYEIT